MPMMAAALLLAVLERMPTRCQTPRPASPCWSRPSRRGGEWCGEMLNV